MKRLTTLLALSALLVGMAALSPAEPNEKPVNWNDLPEPYATPSATMVDELAAVAIATDPRLSTVPTAPALDCPMDSRSKSLPPTPTSSARAS